MPQQEERSQHNDEEKWFNKGFSLGNLGKHVEALKSFNKVLKLNPNHESAWYNKGISLGNLGKHAEALKSFNKVLKLNPNNEDALYNKGAIVGNLGKHVEALKSFNKVTEINQEQAMAYYGKGIANLYLGQYQDSIRNLKTARTLFTEKKAIRASMKAIGQEFRAQGLECWSRGKHEESIQHFTKASETFKSQQLRLAADSLELVIKIIPIDKHFADLPDSKGLLQLKEESLKVCQDIKKLLSEFEQKNLTIDVLEIVKAKANCFEALCDARARAH